MKILEELLESIPADPVPVRKVVIGVHWTMVSSKFSGIASTMVSHGPPGHAKISDVGCLHQKSAQELARGVLSENLLEASVGMAALNSLIPVDKKRLEQINAAEVILRECKDKNLAIIGHFPFVERMKPVAKNCWVIEKRPFGDDFPEEAAQDFIPQADVVAITGAALVNHTIDGLLSLCRPGARIMVLGGSTPLTPLLFDHGVTFIAGSLVVDEDAAATTIQQGAIFPQINGVQHVTMTRGV